MTYDEALRIVGIDDADVETRAVKRAYSRKLRVTRPDDDPDAFMALRLAYDILRGEALYRADNAAHAQHPPEIPLDVSGRPLEVQDNEATASSMPFHTVEDEPSLFTVTVDPVAAVPESAMPWSSGAGDGIPEKSDFELFSELVSGVVFDENKRNDPEEWKSLIRPMREESLDDWALFDDILRSSLIELYSANAPTAEELNKAVAPIEPPIGKGLSASVFVGMGWHNVSETDGHRYNDINWLALRMNGRSLEDARRPRQNVSYETVSESGFSAGNWIWIFAAGFFLIKLVISLVS